MTSSIVSCELPVFSTDCRTFDTEAIYPMYHNHEGCKSPLMICIMGAQMTKLTSRPWQISVTRYTNRSSAECQWQNPGGATNITGTFNFSFKMFCAFSVALARLVAAFRGVGCKISISASCAINPSQVKLPKTDYHFAWRRFLEGTGHFRVEQVWLLLPPSQEFVTVAA